MIKRNLNALVLAVAIGGILMSTQSASAQIVLPGGGTFDLFGPPGLTPEKNILLKAKGGPFNTIYGKFALPAGGELDWHVNPGVAIITATAGLFNEHHSNGCVSLHEVGDVFFETEGDVHKIVNPSQTEPAEGLITFIAPVGSDLVTFVPPPPDSTCAPGEGGHGPGDGEEEDLTEVKEALAANSAAIADVQNLLVRVARALSLRP